MQNATARINKEELGNLSMEILDYMDRISEILNGVESSIEKLSKYYQGSSYNSIITQYNIYRELFPIVKNNIKSYSDDLALIVRKAQEGDKYLSRLFQNLADEYRSKTKKVYFKT